MAVHVVNVRRAFGLVYRELAEIIDVEDGQYANYDFESWVLISDLRTEETAPHRDWVRSVSFKIQVPRVIRLLHYDRVPKHSLRFNRRKLVCPRQTPLPVLRDLCSATRTEHGPRCTAQPWRDNNLGKYRLLLCALQCKERRPHAQRGEDAAFEESGEAEIQSTAGTET